MPGAEKTPLRQITILLPYFSRFCGDQYVASFRTHDAGVSGIDDEMESVPYPCGEDCEPPGLVMSQPA